MKWTLYEKIISILYPRTCPVCTKTITSGYVCPSCFLHIQYVKFPYCIKCGKGILLSSLEYCEDCYASPKSFIRCVALYDYRSPIISKMMAEIKYHNRRDFIDFICDDFIEKKGHIIKEWAGEVFLPVPVHPSKLYTRGFNQAEAMARKLSNAFDIPLDTKLLIRTKRTSPQKKMSASERSANLISAFKTTKRLAYETVILVDDIYTTGSTVEACTKVLMESGIKHVYVICFSR